MKKLAIAVCTGLFLLSTKAQAAMDEYGRNGPILGVQFNGGDGSLRRVMDKGIVLGIAPDAPWTYQDDATKQFAGLDVEILKEACRRIGVKTVTFSIMPFASLAPSLQASRVDVIADNIHINPERITSIAFTSPVYFYGAAIGVQKGNPNHIASWDDLAGKIVGVYKGSQNHMIASRRTDLKELKVYPNSAISLEDLSAGRLDAVFDDDLKIAAFQKANPDANIVLSNAVIPPQYLDGYARYGVRIPDVDLNMALSRSIDEMRADGTVLSMLQKAGLSGRNLLNFPLDH